MQFKNVFVRVLVSFILEKRLLLFCCRFRWVFLTIYLNWFPHFYGSFRLEFSRCIDKLFLRWECGVLVWIDTRRWQLNLVIFFIPCELVLKKVNELRKSKCLKKCNQDKNLMFDRLCVHFKIDGNCKVW